jgi:ribokinase
VADVAAVPTLPFARLTAFGGISYDTVATVKRFPAADDKVWGEVVGRFPGGMGANVAAAFASLGGRAALVSAVGRDRAGIESLSTLRQLGVDTSRVAEVPGSTFQTLAMIDGSGEKAMLLLGAADLVAGADRGGEEPQAGIDAVHVVPGRFAPGIERIASWRRGGIPISLDIEPTMIDQGLDVPTWLAAAAVLFCGECASRMMSPAESLEARLQDLLGRGPEIVVITRGRDGAVLGTRAGEHHAHEGPPVTPVNTTGAGDAFAGTFLFGLSRQWTMRQCLAAANFAGGRCAAQYGSQGVTPSLSEVSMIPEFSTAPLTKEEPA